MNRAEEIRNAEIANLDDVALLRRIVSAGCGSEEVSDVEFKAFTDMIAQARRLSERQRAWAEEVVRRITPIRAADVPRGREVEPPAVLRDLPKTPPGRTSR